MMAPVARQIGDVAVRALLHRIGVAVSVDVAILLMDAATPGASGNAQLRYLTTELTAAKRGLALMRADATRLQHRVTHYQTEAAQWQARAERALRAGDALLARQALARKLHWQRIAGQYTDAQTTQQRSLEQVQTAVAQLEARLRAVQAGRAQGWVSRHRPANMRATHDHGTVEAQWEQFELDQAMDALRRKVQG